MNEQEPDLKEETREASGWGWAHMLWAVSLSVLMFGLGFLAGSRWAEQKAAESERVVVGRPVPPQVEVSPPEQETASSEGQEARVWKILTGQENPSSVLPPSPAAKEGKEYASKPKPPSQPQKNSSQASPSRAQQEVQAQSPSQPPRQPQPPALPPSVASAPGGSRFALQVVSVQSREKAEAILRELNGKGYPLVRIAQAEVPGKGTWYRIVVGSFEKKEEAEALRKQVLEKERLQAQIVPDRR